MKDTSIVDRIFGGKKRVSDVGLTVARYALKDDVSEVAKYKRFFDIGTKAYKFLSGPPGVQTGSLQRTYNWEVRMPFEMGGVDGLDISTLCQEVRFGDYTIGDLSQLRYGPYQAFFPGKLSISTVTLVFVKPLKDCVSSFFYGWRNMVISPAGYYSPKNHYAMSMYVSLLDRGGIQVKEFKLAKVFPKSLPTYDLKYADEDIVRLSIELSVDRIE